MISPAALLSLLAILGYTLVATVIGHLVLSRIHLPFRGLHAAAAPVLGAATLGLQLWLYGALHTPWHPLAVYGPWAILAVAMRHQLRASISDGWRSGRSALRSLTRMDALSIVFAVLIGVIALSYLVNLVLQPLSAWDALSDWLLKAKHFYTVQSVNLSGISAIHADAPYAVVQGQRVADLQRHLDYPPLFPLIVASFYVLIGHVDDTVGKALNLVFLVSAATVCFSVVRSRLGPRLALALTFLMVALPKFLGALFDRYPRDYMGMADYALGAAMLLSLAHLARLNGSRRSESAACALMYAAIAALIKNEGLSFLGIVALILAVQAIGRAPRMRIQLQSTGLVGATAVAILAVATWQIFIKRQGLVNDLIANGHPLTIIPQLPSRFLTIVGYVLGQSPWSPHNDYGWLTACYLLTALLAIRDRARHALLPFIAITLQAFTYLVIYLFTPLPLIYHLFSSFDRLVLELTPSLILLLAIALAPWLTPTPAVEPMASANGSAVPRETAELAGVISA